MASVESTVIWVDSPFNYDVDRHSNILSAITNAEAWLPEVQLLIQNNTARQAHNRRAALKWA